MSKNTVKPSLTANRRTDAVETQEYAAFARRVLRAYSRRVAGGDVEALRDLIALADDIETAIRTAVIGLREHNYSWAEIAARLGVTKQAAHQRWGGDTP
ncbi:MAG TPA: hypothetical protein VFC00_13560 [Micromonosporaceae bacterium]|nr:hypothetical protein [Micromonosporaceae bacterium]